MGLNSQAHTFIEILMIVLNSLFTSGPIAGILADKYGCRLIGMIGGIFMCAGCVISSFATSVPYLYLSYGVITGTLLTLYRMNTLSDSPYSTTNGSIISRQYA